MIGECPKCGVAGGARAVHLCSTSRRALVEFELDESEALAAAYEHLLSLGVDAEAHPLFRGLRRIHQAEAIERQG